MPVLNSAKRKKKKSVLRQAIGGTARGIQKVAGLKTKLENKRSSLIKKGIKKLTGL